MRFPFEATETPQSHNWRDLRIAGALPSLMSSVRSGMLEVDEACDDTVSRIHLLRQQSRPRRTCPSARRLGRLSHLLRETMLATRGADAVEAPALLLGRHRMSFSSSSFPVNNFVLVPNNRLTNHRTRSAIARLAMEGYLGADLLRVLICSLRPDRVCNPVAGDFSSWRYICDCGSRPRPSEWTAFRSILRKLPDFRIGEI
jgi:hypothetical protein